MRSDLARVFEISFNLLSHALDVETKIWKFLNLLVELRTKKSSISIS